MLPPRFRSALSTALVGLHTEPMDIEIGQYFLILFVAGELKSVPFGALPAALLGFARQEIDGLTNLIEQADCVVQGAAYPVPAETILSLAQELEGFGWELDKRVVHFSGNRKAQAVFFRKGVEVPAEFSVRPLVASARVVAGLHFHDKRYNPTPR